jgi:BMFP domain-containing protein YqiC
LSDKGKDGLNDIASKSQLDEDGNELEFIDKFILKANEVKNELEQKIEEHVVKIYKTMNIAHLDELKALNEKVVASDKEIALLEARLNKLESKQ